MNKNIKTALWVTLLPILVATLFVISVIWDGERSKPLKVISLYPKSKSVIDFKLLTSNANDFSNKELIGHFSLLFFGYSHCPDICPTTLANLAKIYRGMSAQAKINLKVVFVSVDPKRDTPAELKQYIQFFDPSFQAVTGTVKQLTAMMKSMDALFITNKANSQGDYLIDHTSKVFVLNPRAELIGIFSGQPPPTDHQYPIQQTINDLEKILAK